MYSGAALLGYEEPLDGTALLDAGFLTCRQLTMTRIGEPGDLRRSNVAVSLTSSEKAMAQLPQSPEPVCNWFQQILEFDDVPNVNTIIDEILNIFKDRAREI